MKKFWRWLTRDPRPPMAIALRMSKKDYLFIMKYGKHATRQTPQSTQSV
jgi:hypothetical protein